MKTHLTAFLVTVGFFAATTLIAFALCTCRWISIALLFAILFAFVYYITYTTIKDTKEKTKNETPDAAPSHPSYKSHQSHQPTISPLIIHAAKMGTMSDYLRLEKHDPNTLYYITDKDLTYMGDTLLSEIFSSDTTPVPSVLSVP